MVLKRPVCIDLAVKNKLKEMNTKSNRKKQACECLKCIVQNHPIWMKIPSLLFCENFLHWLSVFHLGWHFRVLGGERAVICYFVGLCKFWKQLKGNSYYLPIWIFAVLAFSVPVVKKPYILLCLFKVSPHVMIFDHWWETTNTVKLWDTDFFFFKETYYRKISTICFYFSKYGYYRLNLGSLTLRKQVP